MLNAMMLDGFGWFSSEKYRRTLLLFDQIEYVFPKFQRGFIPPPELYSRPDFQVTQPESDPGTLRGRIEVCREDLNDPGMVAILDTIAASDLDYARQVAGMDSELRAHPGWLPDEPRLALLYLAEKLLDHSDLARAIPVVGQDYAAEILARKARRRLTGGTHLRSKQDLVGPTQASSVHALAAGLSFSFLEDADLLKPPIEKLMRFKERNKDLLERHHTMLLKAAYKYTLLPDAGPEFDQQMRALRVEMTDARGKIEHEASVAWVSEGLEAGGKLVDELRGGIPSLITALGLVGAGSTAIPGAATTVGLVGGVAALALQLFSWRQGVARARNVQVSYLMNAESFLKKAVAA